MRFSVGEHLGGYMFVIWTTYMNARISVRYMLKTEITAYANIQL